MRSQCYIYGLRAKDSERYFYVGSTKGTLAKRWRHHQENLKRNRNYHFVRTVKAIGAENVLCEVIEEVPIALRFVRESYWIQRLPALTNKMLNPASLCLSEKIPTADEIQAKLNKVRGRSPLSNLVANYAQAVVGVLHGTNA